MIKTFNQWKIEREIMFQAHPCRVTDKMRNEWALMKQPMMRLHDANDYSITIIDLSTG